MGIRNAQSQLDALYAAYDDLIAGKLQSYQMGDRQITLFNIKDLQKIIWIMESAVTANQPIVADLRFTGNGQESYGSGYLS